MSKLELSPEAIHYVLSDIKALCARVSYCDSCRYYIPGEGCSLAHLPERWQLDDLIRKGGAADDPN